MDRCILINLYRFCRLGGRTGAEGVVPPFSEIHNFFVKYRECLYFSRVFSTGSDEIFILTRYFKKVKFKGSNFILSYFILNGEI